MAYKQVYFRIKSGYMRPNENREAFYEEIQRLFTDAGWEIVGRHSFGSCPDAVKGRNRLYIHPQEASGPVEEELIPIVEGILSTGTTFKHYHTDIYETLYDLTDEEYMARLEQAKGRIESDLLTVFKTKRRNLFVTDTWNALYGVSRKHRIPRLARPSTDLEFGYTERLFRQLLSEGKFATANTKHGMGYRTA